MIDDTFYKEEIIRDIDVGNGYLNIISNDKIITQINVPSPDEESMLYTDGATTTSEHIEIFYDDYSNEYYVEIFPSFNDVRYVIASECEEEDEINNLDEAKKFFNNLKVTFEPYENSYNEPKSFFTLKTSKEEGIKKLLSFYKEKNTNDLFSFGGLTQLFDKVKENSLVFLVAGGDKGKINFDYTQGLYGIAKVIKAPYDKNGRAYKIDIKFLYFFDSIITRDMFYDFVELKNIPNIGPMTKGEKTQAISSITKEKAKNILLTSAKITKISNLKLFSMFPWVKDEYKTIATENFKSLIDTLPPALNVDNISKVFATYLKNYNSEYTATLIGIFGMWGRGKTYFFNRVKDYILSTNQEEKIFYFCKFQPWKYQKRESAWAYLYQTILESYLEKDINKIDTKITKFDFLNNLISKTSKKLLKEKDSKIFLLNLKRLGSTKIIFSFLFILLTAIWLFTPFKYKFDFITWIIGLIGFSGIIFIYKSYSFYNKTKNTAKNIIDTYGKTNDYSNYLGFQSEIEKELNFLLKTYIKKDKEKLILFIDDLDRCNEDMIIDIIDGLKLVLDNEEINSRLVIVTAIDERVLEKAIKHKYLSKELVENIGIKEYIEKFFLMGIKLNQLHDSDVEELVNIYTSKLNQNLPSNKIKKIDSHFPNTKENNNTTITNEIEKDIIEKVEENENNTKNNVENVKDTNPSSINELNAKPLVLDQYEINYIKEELKRIDLLTPRKINMIIHRYLIFKSLILNILDSSIYDNFDSKMLVKIVIQSQNKSNLENFINHYKSNTDHEIPILIEGFETDKINRNEYITLIKFAEMVSPF